MAAPVRVVHSIVCCRILLNLRRAAAWKGGSTEASHIIAFATALEQQTNQAETIRHETYDTWSDEEDPHRQVDGISTWDRHCTVEELSEASTAGRI
jgi:hypothetical protein